MKVSIKSIVSNSEMIKNYKTCREKTEITGKIFIFKNNQPDAVLFSITEYERIAPFVEFMENHSEEETARLILTLKKPAGSPE